MKKKLKVNDNLFWTKEFDVINWDEPISKLISMIKSRRRFYIIIKRNRDMHYVYKCQELLADPGIKDVIAKKKPANKPIFDVINFHESHCSATCLPDKSIVPSWHTVSEDIPTSGRHVQVDEFNAPLNISPGTERFMLKSMKNGYDPAFILKSTNCEEPDENSGSPQNDQNDTDRDPVRNPSICADSKPLPGAPFIITVDLLFQTKNKDTIIDKPFALRGVPPEWKTLDVKVELICDGITFESNTGIVKVNRNAKSIPCTFKGIIDKACSIGQKIEVFALFSFQERTCAIAKRVFETGSLPESLFIESEEKPWLNIDLSTAAPDLTIKIIQPNPSNKGYFVWIVNSPHAKNSNGFPVDCRGECDLGTSYGSELADEFRKCADREPGDHMDGFYGFGERLYTITPECFKTAYWALRKASGAGFSIQIITNDTSVPWELMRPFTDDEFGELLLMTHPVARWAEKSNGTPRTTIKAGEKITIAPDYRSRDVTALAHAKEESIWLKSKGAVQGPCEKKGFKDLLKQGGKNPISLIHFAGHGKWKDKNVDQSVIMFEDRDLAAEEINIQEVRLGIKDGPLVILNACEIAAGGNFLGAAGGFAEAFTSRRFGGIIAPLWAVFDDHARNVLETIITEIDNGNKISDAMLKVRKEFASVSPTYLAYLFYGDVMTKIEK
ncbi:MAG: CHAT domain-containing protein [Chitinispirillaceae bacterium]|nr:CHAT domain-containing protein [Chitinispirillaceae bacterium]